MKKLLVVLLIGFIAFGCGSKKKIVTKKGKTKQQTERVVKIPNPTADTGKPLETSNTGATSLNSTEVYINNFSTIAMDEMRKYKIPASITLAQGILESGSGKGRLSVEANNHFGIKCHGWQGEKIYHDDDRSQECFRKYDQAQTSFEDHSAFLTSRSRYSKLFSLRLDDYKGWAKGLRAAGYATDRKYPEKLISLIERYQLYTYDEMVLKTAAKTEDLPEDYVSLSHRVVRGDTLYSLSKKYNTTVEELKRINGLKSTDLSLGQMLIIKTK